MTEQDLLVLQNFAALWERVQHGGGSSLAAGDVREEVLEHLYTLRAGYEDMARQACGQARRRLLCMEKETSTMLRYLQAGLLLDTGDTFIPVKCRIFCKFDAIHLQKMWRDTIQVEEVCRKADFRGNPHAASDLAAVEDMMKKHRTGLRCILQEIL